MRTLPGALVQFVRTRLPPSTPTSPPRPTTRKSVSFGVPLNQCCSSPSLKTVSKDRRNSKALSTPNPYVARTGRRALQQVERNVGVLDENEKSSKSDSSDSDDTDADSTSGLFVDDQGYEGQDETELDPPTHALSAKDDDDASKGQCLKRHRDGSRVCLSDNFESTIIAEDGVSSSLDVENEQSSRNPKKPSMEILPTPGPQVPIPSLRISGTERLGFGERKTSGTIRLVTDDENMESTQEVSPQPSAVAAMLDRDDSPEPQSTEEWAARVQMDSSNFDTLIDPSLDTTIGGLSERTVRAMTPPLTISREDGGAAGGLPAFGAPSTSHWSEIFSQAHAKNMSGVLVTDVISVEDAREAERQQQISRQLSHERNLAVNDRDFMSVSALESNERSLPMLGPSTVQNSQGARTYMAPTASSSAKRRADSIESVVDETEGQSYQDITAGTTLFQAVSEPVDVRLQLGSNDDGVIVDYDDDDGGSSPPRFRIKLNLPRPATSPQRSPRGRTRTPPAPPTPPRSRRQARRRSPSTSTSKINYALMHDPREQRQRAIREEISLCKARVKGLEAEQAALDVAENWARQRQGL